jgi:hypothetical protein
LSLRTQCGDEGVFETTFGRNKVKLLTNALDTPHKLKSIFRGDIAFDTGGHWDDPPPLPGRELH